MALPSTEVRLDVRLAECRICYEAYKGTPSGGRVPKLLWCRHSLCLTCLRKLVCWNGALPFVVCPFCRTVTVVPEGGLQALRDDEALLQEMAPRGMAGAEEAPGPDKAPSRGPGGCLGDSTLSLDVAFGYRTGSIFTISSIVPAYPTGLSPGMGFWGSFHRQEVLNTMLLELPSRACFRGSQAPPSVENLRLCFAVAIILLIVSVFFSLVFFK